MSQIIPNGKPEPPNPKTPMHAVISTFDLFSIGVGPSSSHTVGPMRAGRIFAEECKEMGILEKVTSLKITLYGSLAATGKGHLTPQALMMGFEGEDCETIDTASIPYRFTTICDEKTLNLMGIHRIKFDIERDISWRWDTQLKRHPNGMRFSVFDENGDILGSNVFFSIGGGFVINERLQNEGGGENVFYKQINPAEADPGRRAPLANLSIPPPAPQLSIPSSSEDSLKATEEPKGKDDVGGAAPEAGRESEGTSGGEGGGAKDGDQAKGGEVKGIPLPFWNAASLLQITKDHNLTIAQVVFNNELTWRNASEIKEQLLKIWRVMDDCIRVGVHSDEEELPGRLKMKRRAKGLYTRLMAGFFIEGSTTPKALPHSPPPESNATATTEGSTPSQNANAAILAAEGDNQLVEPPSSSSSQSYFKSQIRPANIPTAPPIRGSWEHPLKPIPPRRISHPTMDFLSMYAIAVNEVNAAGGRVVTAPTNGASGVIPAVLAYVLQFISQDPERDIQTFLLTASAIGMLYKRGATISAAEGGCMAEVGVACSMAAAGFAACMGASPEVIEQAAEIGIEHNLGLTCDPIDGLVQAPCIERNALGAVKAVTAAQLALATAGNRSITLDEAIDAMRVTAADMHVKYKETSMSGLATSVKIPVAVPDC